MNPVSAINPSVNNTQGTTSIASINSSERASPNMVAFLLSVQSGPAPNKKAEPAKDILRQLSRLSLKRPAAFRLPLTKDLALSGDL